MRRNGLILVVLAAVGALAGFAIAGPFERNGSVVIESAGPGVSSTSTTQDTIVSSTTDRSSTAVTATTLAAADSSTTIQTSTAAETTPPATTTPAATPDDYHDRGRDDGTGGRAAGRREW